jgi:hypothetical protein
LSLQVCLANRDTTHEYTRCLAPGPRLFGKPLVIEPSAGQFSGDAGLLPVRTEGLLAEAVAAYERERQAAR